METTKQQLYERKGLPEGFYPNDSIVFEIDQTDTKFTTDKTYIECKFAAENGVLFIAKRANGAYVCNNVGVDSLGNIYFGFNYIIANSDIYKIYRNNCVFAPDYSKKCTSILIIDTLKLPKYVKLNNTYNSITNSILRNIYNINLRNEINLDCGLNNLKSYSKLEYSVFYESQYGTKILSRLDGNNNILLTIIYSGSIAQAVIDSEGNTNINVISFNDTTLYRTSNLNIEPITNPKIWVGTAVQYAAIGTKDNNTTYIIKTDS